MMNLVLSSFMIYHRICNKSNTTGATCRAHMWNCLPFQCTWVHLWFLVRIVFAWILVFCVMFCRSLFVLLSFFSFSHYIAGSSLIYIVLNIAENFSLDVKHQSINQSILDWWLLIKPLVSSNFTHRILVTLALICKKKTISNSSVDTYYAIAKYSCFYGFMTQFIKMTLFSNSYTKPLWSLRSWINLLILEQFPYITIYLEMKARKIIIKKLFLSL